MKEITINHEPVELFKILKFEGLASSGAEAKILISEGLIRVNNQIEKQKRKKILVGDTISFNSETFLIVARA